jgi:hypothetical protein
MPPNAAASATLARKFDRKSLRRESLARPTSRASSPDINVVTVQEKRKSANH